MVDVGGVVDVGGTSLVGCGVFLKIEWNFRFDVCGQVADASSFDGLRETVVPTYFSETHLVG